MAREALIWFSEAFGDAVWVDRFIGQAEKWIITTSS
jgi:hypothetical protein